MAGHRNDDLLNAFQEANEVTNKRKKRMDEIFDFLTKNQMFPNMGLNQRTAAKVSRKIKAFT